MKHLLGTTLALAVLAAAVPLSRAAETSSTSPGYVDFGKFAPPSSGGEFVEVHLQSNLIGMVARLVKQEEPEVADLLRGLQLVRVTVIGLDDKNREEITARVGKIRGELEAQGWQRVVTVQEKDEDIGVYVKTRGEEAVEGVVVTVIEGQGEAVFVNIVGDLKPEKLALVGERLHIDPLKKVGEAIKKS
jgi:hypothetical protein